MNAPEKERLVQEAHDALDLVETQERTMVPQVQIINPVRVQAVTKQKAEDILHTIVDAKHRKLEQVALDCENMDLDKWSKIVARLKDRDVKIDMNINAMGIFAMFPVAVETQK